MVNKTGLRESLKAAVKRNPDAIDIISMVSGVPENEIQKFVDGDDEALREVQMMVLKVHQ